MKYYLKLAKSYNYNNIILEPKTPWKTDASILAQKTTHGLDEEFLSQKVLFYLFKI